MSLLYRIFHFKSTIWHRGVCLSPYKSASLASPKTKKPKTKIQSRAMRSLMMPTENFAFGEYMHACRLVSTKQEPERQTRGRICGAGFRSPISQWFVLIFSYCSALAIYPRSICADMRTPHAMTNSFSRSILHN